jgi:signal transduction histidine kinase
MFPDLADRGLGALYEDALAGQVRLMSQRFHAYFLSMPAPGEPEFAQMQQTAYIAPLLQGDIVVGTITVINDVTERAAREKELRRARDEAEEANRAKDRFIATLSHDLRTPLNSIVGWLHLMQSHPDNHEIRDRALRSMSQSTKVQIGMIDDLLDLTRIASGKFELEREACDLVTVIHNACEVLKPTAEAKEVSLVWPGPNGAPLMSIDPKRMQQVVWNLISNAIKFTPRGGSVTVSLKDHGSSVEMSVSDTGIGLSPEAISRVFEPMWQANQEPGSGNSGLGLGLSIVRRIVELHGGTVRAESAGLRHGTTFTVDLPLDQDAARLAP